MKQKRTCSKSLYAAIAVLVLLVAAGIASYAAATPGAATHGTLYTDTISEKGSRGWIDVTSVLKPTQAIFSTNAITGTSLGPGLAGIIGINSVVGGFGVMGAGNAGTGVMGSGAIGVAGGNSAGTNVGKLGTSSAGVEGTNAAGNTGKLGAATAGVEGSSSGGYGVKGGSTNNYGVYGGSTNSVGVYGAGSTRGVQGLAAMITGYGGYFTGGRGLYAERIDFGSAAFSATNGYLLLGVPQDGVSCTAVCTTHGLICAAAVPIQPGTANCDSNGVGTIARNCWCD